jgi:hypothetical protein
MTLINKQSIMKLLFIYFLVLIFFLIFNLKMMIKDDSNKDGIKSIIESKLVQDQFHYFEKFFDLL